MVIFQSYVNVYQRVLKDASKMWCPKWRPHFDRKLAMSKNGPIQWFHPTNWETTWTQKNWASNGWLVSWNISWFGGEVSLTNLRIIKFVDPYRGFHSHGWMLYNGKSIYKWMIWGYPYFRKPPYGSMVSPWSATPGRPRDQPVAIPQQVRKNLGRISFAWGHPWWTNQLICLVVEPNPSDQYESRLGWWNSQ